MNRKPKRTTAQLLRQLAEDYLHLAQDADGNVDGQRRKRYRWLVQLSVRLTKKERAETYPASTDERCYACERKLGRDPHLVTTTDGQRVYVGRECFALIKAAGKTGYQPPQGGPKLFLQELKQENG